MLGRRSPQGALFRPDHVLRDHVGTSSFYGFLAREGRRLFRDEDFAGLFNHKRGRPSVPPSQLCVALILQTKDGVSDYEAIQRTAFDLRWKVALGLELDEFLCAKSTLQLFRAKLILNEQYGEVFQASVDECLRVGLSKHKKLEVAVDTTPILGRGAVKDTFNLISDQIRTVVGQVVALTGVDRDSLVFEHGLTRHFGTSFKAEADLDWSDASQKRALVGQLVCDARVVLELGKKALESIGEDAEGTRGLRQAVDLLADLLLQDVEEKPEDGQGPQIRQGTSRDRIVSTTDSEMRHGRKSSSKRFDGYKASVIVDSKDGVVLATDVHPANAPDKEGTRELVAQASDRSHQAVDAVLGDTAYGDLETRDALSEDGVETVAKVAPAGKRLGKFTVEDFSIDVPNLEARCPAGKSSARSSVTKPKDGKGRARISLIFSREDCERCPLREACTSSKQGFRTITVHEDYDRLCTLRAEQRTEPFKRRYRKRVIVEHRLARLVQLGIRQGRYLGRAKTAFQLAMAAAVANFVLAASNREGSPTFGLSYPLECLKHLLALAWRTQTEPHAGFPLRRTGEATRIRAA